MDDPRATLVALTGGPFATPTIVIEDEVLVGFDPDRMAALLGI